MKRSYLAILAVLFLAGCGPRPIDATSQASGADWPWYHGNPTAPTIRP